MVLNLSPGTKCYNDRVVSEDWEGAVLLQMGPGCNYLETKHLGGLEFETAKPPQRYSRLGINIF